MMSASSCQIYTFSSIPNFYARVDEFGTKCGHLVFKKTPASFVGELGEDRSIPKTAKLTYHDETLVLKMLGPPHETAKNHLMYIIQARLPNSFEAEVVGYASAAIITNDWAKEPDGSWGPPLGMNDSPEAANAPSSRTLVMEVGSSEPGYMLLLESAPCYLDAGIPYVLVVDISQVQPRITVQLLEARTHLSRSQATRTTTIVVERNSIGEPVIAQSEPIIIPVADLARRGYQPGDGSVTITDDDVRYLAQLVWRTQRFP